jgi:hypothetical protein
MTLNSITIISTVHGKPTPRRPLWQPQKSVQVIVSAIPLPAPRQGASVGRFSIPLPLRGIHWQKP